MFRLDLARLMWSLTEWIKAASIDIIGRMHYKRRKGGRIHSRSLIAAVCEL